MGMEWVGSNKDRRPQGGGRRAAGQKNFLLHDPPFMAARWRVISEPYLEC